MIVEFPDFVFGWFFHDDEKDKYIIDKNAPKKVIDFFKDIDDEYFDSYKIHIVDFEDEENEKITKDYSLFEKVKRFFIK